MRRRWEPQRVPHAYAVTLLQLLLLYIAPSLQNGMVQERRNLAEDPIGSGDGEIGSPYGVNHGHFGGFPGSSDWEVPYRVEPKREVSTDKEPLPDYIEYQTYIKALAYPARLVVRPDHSTVASDSPITFFCRSDGNPLPLVNWRVNGKAVPDSRFHIHSSSSGLSTLRIDPVTSADNGTLISCSADNGVASPIHAEAILTVIAKKDLPTGFPRIEGHPSIKAVEQGRTAHVTCRVEGEPRPKVLWLRDNIPVDIRANERYSVATLTNPGALMIQVAREEDQGKYECIARNIHGVQHSRAAQLYVKVRRVPPYFSVNLEKSYKVGVGGSINLTCVAVGYPMPRILWKKMDEPVPEDFASAPIGRNILTLSNMEQTENYSCVAMSKLGDITAHTTVYVRPLPAAPVNLHATAASSSTLSISWEPVAESTEEPITKHIVKYRVKQSRVTSPTTTQTTGDTNEYGDSSKWKEHVVAANEKQTTISGLEPYTVYEFVVQSFNEIGGGSLSHPREAQTDDDLPGSPPLKVQAKAYQSSGIVVQWLPPDVPNGILTSYNVYYTDGDGKAPLEKWKMHNTSNDERTATIRDLLSDKRYHVVVKAVNRKGQSPPSKSVPVRTYSGLPGQVIGLTSSPLDATRVQLIWDRPIFSSPITGYTIIHNGSSTEKEINLTSTNEKYIFTDLQPFTTYSFRVAARSSRGSGEPSEETIVTTLNGTLFPSPILQSPSNITSSSLTISWSTITPTVPLPFSTLRGFVVRYRNLSVIPHHNLDESSEEYYRSKTRRKKNQGVWTEVRVGGVYTTVLSNLTPHTKYEITVAGETEEAGVGHDSNVVTMKTLEGAAPPPMKKDELVPSAPRGLKVELVNANEVRLSWEPPLHENGVMKGYYVYKERLENGVPVGGGLQKAISIRDPKKLHTTVGGLDPNREYSFRVNAFNKNGDGEFSESKSIVTGGIPPKQPEIIGVTLKKPVYVSPLKATIEWKMPVIDSLDAPIDRYHIWYRSSSHKDFKHFVTKDGFNTSFEIDGLWMGEQYEILLGAENVEGLSPNATESLATPDGVPEAEPINVQYEIISGNRMKLSWDPPVEEKRNGAITGYKAILTPMDGSNTRKEEVTPTNSVIFKVEPNLSYTFKVSASTTKGHGPYSPVLTINPNPEVQSYGSSTMPSSSSSSSSSSLSSADVFNAILHRPPGPMDIVDRDDNPSILDGAIIQEIRMTSATIPKDGWTNPEPERISVNKERNHLETTEEALVGPPSNVRVEAISNTSAVVRWDYNDQQPVDGFVVKYIHEPGDRTDSERWTSQSILDPNAKDLVIPKLMTHKPYAFCVSAIKQNRQGSCSEPYVVVEKLIPQYIISNLQIEWKTANSVRVRWDYRGPSPVEFYLNYTGRKEYLDGSLASRSMVSPGGERIIQQNVGSFLFSNLRAAMTYKFTVGVRHNDINYWPLHVETTTEPTGPPLVDIPIIHHSKSSGGLVYVTLNPSSEEYGVISHYWLIVVPGNYTNETVLNLDNHQLERMTNAKKNQLLGSSLSIQSMKKVKRSRKRNRNDDDDDDSEEYEWKRFKRDKVDSSVEAVVLPSELDHSLDKRSIPTVNGPYITASIPSEEMKRMKREGSLFAIGDQQTRHNQINFALEPDHQYKVFLRAFAKTSDLRKELDQRPPMSDMSTKLYTDSYLSEGFAAKSSNSGRTPTSASQAWLIGPVVALAVIVLLILMLVCWWFRCNKKSVGRGSMRHHGSITKVALGGSHMNGNGNGHIGETSKLLGADYARTQIMHPYDQLNGNNSSSLDHLYPLPTSQSRPFSNGNVNGYSTMPHLPSSGGVIGGHSLSHPPVPISELENHIERLKANNNAGFIQEFESIETGQQFTWDASSAEYNKHKNRYANVVAYDHSRVILNAIDGIPGSDYINANYIDGYERQRAYIATQGPLPETFDDFWRMVWEEGSATIVMLTNLEEQNRIKCDQYWPSRGSTMYGDLEVTLLETTVLAHYTMRTMRLSMIGEGESREIRHLQYTAWPDHGVPDHPTPFLVFLKRVKTLNPPDAGPIISHCSAGIGRTGAFIVIDVMLERLRYEHTVDIFGCVTALRSQRTYMVQIDDQYMFIHDAVLDAVTSGSTEVPAKRLQHHMSTHANVTHDGMSSLEAEFRMLNTFRVRDGRCIEANQPVNRYKNRSMTVVPYDINRVVLSTVPGVDGSDYINASWIDGYRERNAYIATQAPSDPTITDFWRMIWENEAGIIVVLKMSYEGNGREHAQSRLEYWPSEAGVQFGSLVVEPIAEYNMPQYILREFKISDLQSSLSRTVRHFEYIDWPELSLAPKSAEYFIDFIQQVHKTKCQFGVDGPIVVHCSTGAGRTGVFIALAHIIDRIRLEHVVDVFTTVKVLRTERQGMVQERDQYQFLYIAAREFLTSI